MWTKVPYECRCLELSPATMQVEVRSVSPDRDGVQRVGFYLQDISIISKEQLDPRVVNITSLLENKTIIDPGEVYSMLSISDPADIERFNDAQNQTLYNYLVENQDVIKAQLSDTE